MKIKLLSLLFFTIFSIGLHAQVKEKEKYTKKELQTFLKVYKYSLDTPFDLVGSMQKNAPKIKISEERFSEILQAQFAGSKPNLSETETKEMAKLKLMLEADKAAYDNELKKYTITQGLTYEKYKEIEKEYNTNTKFQKKVSKLIQK